MKPTPQSSQVKRSAELVLRPPRTGRKVHGLEDHELSLIEVEQGLSEARRAGAPDHAAVHGGMASIAIRWSL